MQCQSAISTPPLCTYPLQIHPPLPPPPPAPTSVQRPPLSYTPILPSRPSWTPPSTLIQLTFHFPLQLRKPLPAHLPLTHPHLARAQPLETYKDSHSPDHAHDQAGCRSFVALAKQQVVLRAQFFCARLCSEQKLVGRACSFEESQSRRKLADRKLVYALRRPRRAAQKAQTTNHNHKKSTKKHTKTQKNHKLPITTTKKHQKNIQTNHKNTNYQSRPKNKKHKLQITTTKKAKKKKLPITTTEKHKKAHKTQKNTNYRSRPQKKQENTKNTNYRTRLRKSKFPYM